MVKIGQDRCNSCFYYTFDEDVMCMTGTCRFAEPECGPDGRGRWPLVEENSGCGRYLFDEGRSAEYSERLIARYMIDLKTAGGDEEGGEGPEPGEFVMRVDEWESDERSTEEGGDTFAVFGVVENKRFIVTETSPAGVAPGPIKTGHLVPGGRVIGLAELPDGEIDVTVALGERRGEPRPSATSEPGTLRAMLGEVVRRGTWPEAISANLLIGEFQPVGTPDPLRREFRIRGQKISAKVAHVPVKWADVEPLWPVAVGDTILDEWLVTEINAIGPSEVRIAARLLGKMDPDEAKIGDTPMSEFEEIDLSGVTPADAPSIEELRRRAAVALVAGSAGIGPPYPRDEQGECDVVEAEWKAAIGAVFEACRVGSIGLWGPVERVDYLVDGKVDETGVLEIATPAMGERSVGFVRLGDEVLGLPVTFIGETSGGLIYVVTSVGEMPEEAALDGLARAAADQDEVPVDAEHAETETEHRESGATVTTVTSHAPYGGTRVDAVACAAPLPVVEVDEIATLPVEEAPADDKT